MIPLTTKIFTLSLHDALPILPLAPAPSLARGRRTRPGGGLRVAAAHGPRHLGGRRGHGERRDLSGRSEEHTSELQSQSKLVCRLLLEKTNLIICIKTFFIINL